MDRANGMRDIRLGAQEGGLDLRKLHPPGNCAKERKPFPEQPQKANRRKERRSLARRQRNAN